MLVVMTLFFMLSALIAVVMALASLAVALLTLNNFNRLLTPDLGNKARMIGRVMEADVETALRYGIPFEFFSDGKS